MFFEEHVAIIGARRVDGNDSTFLRRGGLALGVWRRAGLFGGVFLLLGLGGVGGVVLVLVLVGVDAIFVFFFFFFFFLLLQVRYVSAPCEMSLIIFLWNFPSIFAVGWLCGVFA